MLDVAELGFSCLSFHHAGAFSGSFQNTGLLYAISHVSQIHTSCWHSIANE
jgi:hypothetical protein